MLSFFVLTLLCSYCSIFLTRISVVNGFCDLLLLSVLRRDFLTIQLDLTHKGVGPVFVECIGKVIKLCKEFSACVLEVIFNKVASPPPRKSRCYVFIRLSNGHCSPRPQEEPALCVNQALKSPLLSRLLGSH